jgi:hypothetical protein
MKAFSPRHCEARGDVAIQRSIRRAATLISLRRGVDGHPVLSSPFCFDQRRRAGYFSGP